MTTLLRKLLVVASICLMIVLCLTAHCKEVEPFTFYADDCKANIITAEVSEHFGITILVSPEVKNKTVTGSVDGVDLDAVLKSLTWLLDCEYKINNGIYYLGGQSDDINIVNSGGLGIQLQKAFDTLKIVGDKAVITGSEADVKRVSDAVKTAIDRPFLEAYLSVYTYTYSEDQNLTFSINPELTGKTVSFSDFTNGTVQPFDFLFDPDASTVGSSYENQYEQIKADELLSTSLGLLSAHTTEFHVGDTQERQIFSKVPDTEGEFITDYKSFNSGVEITLMPYKAENAWFITSRIRQSSYTGELKKDESTFSNTSKVESEREYILASFKKKKEVERREGLLYMIPFLSDYLPPQKEILNYTLLIVLSVK